MTSLAETATPADLAASEGFRIGWVGGAPAWATEEPLPGTISLERADRKGSSYAVLHVRDRSQLPIVRGLPLPDAFVVLDLSEEKVLPLSRRDAWRARHADCVLVGTLAELRELRRRHPALAAKSALFRRPVDLEAYAPLKTLQTTRDAEIKRFRRLHRLAGPIVLFAGPYTPAGGLDLALDAVYRLRESIPELRLAAVPHDAVDEDYLDRCERRALALGHHGIVEWNPAPSDLPLWYALASVVCTPAREPVGPLPAKLAAAAARPFVGTQVDGLEEHVVDGRTGFLVGPGDLDALTGTIEGVLGDGDAAAELGASARAWAERELSAETAARRLRSLWLEGSKGGERGHGRASGR